MSGWMRQIHRWLSLAFSVMVVVNISAMFLPVSEQTGMILGMSALIPLIPLLFTGIYLFALPYLPGSGAQPSAH